MAPNDTQLLERIRAGRLIEGLDHDGIDLERYIEGLKRTLIVSGDTELISAPAYLRAAKDAPKITSYMSAVGIIQDELGHAHIAYRLLSDLGVDTHELVYERDPEKFKHPYTFDVPLDTWVELIMANAFYDRAGFVLLSDIYSSTSYGPWKRALVKVDREEGFHLRHGERWMKILVRDDEKRAELQRAIDWMFVLTLEWFGLPDELKTHSEQIEYGMKGMTNDELRQEWMKTAVPLCEELGLRVPAHYDEPTDSYVIDCPFPMEFGEDTKEWNYDRGEITWDEVLRRWKKRGPANEELVGQLQRAYKNGKHLLA